MLKGKRSYTISCDYNFHFAGLYIMQTVSVLIRLCSEVSDLCCIFRSGPFYETLDVYESKNQDGKKVQQRHLLLCILLTCIQYDIVQ